MLLPFMDQAAAAEKFDWNGTSPGFTGEATGQTYLEEANRVPAFSLCPSFPTFGDQPNREGYSNYVGISGAVDIPSFKEERIGSWTQGPSPTLVSGGGLMPANFSSRIKDARDGMSNTILLGEMGGLSKLPDGTKIVIHGTGASKFGDQDVPGWMVGCATSASLGQRPMKLLPGKQIPLNPDGETDLQMYNITTIRHGIGKGPFDPTQYPGYAMDGGGNNPLISSHNAGAHVLVGDGSVRFVAENVNLDTLKYLATRDDHQSVGEY